MSETLKQNEVLVQIGVTALRSPDGSFLPSVPLYIKADKSEEIPQIKATVDENGFYNDIAEVLLPKYKEYINNVKKAKREQKRKA